MEGEAGVSSVLFTETELHFMSQEEREPWRELSLMGPSL